MLRPRTDGSGVAQGRTQRVASGVAISGAFVPRLNLLARRRGRFLTFGLLYISEGVPYGFSATAIAAFLRQAGVSLEEIGAYSAALILPWAFKWVVAPAVDVIPLGRWGGRKGWILGCLAMMIATLSVTAALDLKADFPLLMAAIVLNNVFCATQDVAIDSLAVSTLKPEERGRGNGVMFGGQYLGIALGGGGAIFVYGLAGFDAALAYVSALLALMALYVTLFISDPEAGRRTEGGEGRAALKAIAERLARFVRTLAKSFFNAGTGPKAGLAFAALPVGAMALSFALLQSLKVDYGLSDNQIAQLSVFNTIAGGLGSLLGGVLGDRFGLRPSMAAAFILSAVPPAVLGLLIESRGLGEIALPVFYAITICAGLLYGMGFALQAAVYMGMTNPAVAASQFTAFMALGNLVISYTNYWQGLVAERFGYAAALYLDAAIVALPLALIPFLRPRQAEARAAATRPAVD